MTKVLKNSDKNGGGGEGGRVGDNDILTFCPSVLHKNATFLFIFNTRLPIHGTEEIAFGAISSGRICNLLIPAFPKDQLDLRLSVRTENPFSCVSQNLPANEATGHQLTVECNQTKKSMGSRNTNITDSTLWSSCSRGNKFECGG